MCIKIYRISFDAKERKMFTKYMMWVTEVRISTRNVFTLTAKGDAPAKKAPASEKPPPAAEPPKEPAKPAEAPKAQSSSSGPIPTTPPPPPPVPKEPMSSYPTSSVKVTPFEGSTSQGGARTETRVSLCVNVV